MACTRCFSLSIFDIMNFDENFGLIFVSMEDWDDVWRRNQFFCAEFARRYPNRQILFVGLARDITAQLRQGNYGILRAPSTWTVPGFPNITVTRPLKVLPNSFARARNESMVRSHVQRVARRLGIQKPILWLNPHYAVHMVGKMEERAVIYDITDDWTALAQNEALTQLVTIQDAELCRRADAVIVCSEKLFALKQSLARNLHLIPNGVDAEHYRRVLDSDAPLRPETAHWTKPILGYTGSIHPERVDVTLIEAVARHFAQGTVALVGPNMLPSGDRARLEACGNVVLTGSVPYTELPDYMRAFDVCMTPHRVTSFTESLNPIKLWEYLAAGKPIVATNVAGFRDYPEFVRIAADAPQFIRYLEEALQEDRGVGELRRREARQHSWSSRWEQVEAVLAQCLRNREETRVMVEGVSGGKSV